LPKVPLPKEGQRLRPSSPVAVASSGRARLEGEADANLGQSLQKGAAGVANFLQQEQGKSDRLFRDAMESKALEAAQRSYYKSESAKQDPDGSEKLQIYEDEYENLTSSMLDGLDPRRMQIAKTAIADSENMYRGQVFKSSLVSRRKYNFSLAEEKLNVSTSLIMADPDLAISEREKYFKSIDDLDLDPTEREKFVQEADVAFLMAEANHHILKKDYKTAKTTILANSELLGSKRTMELTDGIDDIQIRKERRLLAIAENKRKAEKAEMDKESRLIMSDLVQSALLKDPGRRNAAILKASKLLEQKKINPEKVISAMSYDHKVKADVSEYTLANFIERKEINPFISDRKLLDEAIEAKADGRMTGDDFRLLVNELNEGETATPDQRDNISSARNIIKSYKVGGKMSISGMIYSDEIERLNKRALHYFNAKKDGLQKTEANINRALKDTIKKFYGKEVPLSAGVDAKLGDLRTKEGIDKSIIRTKNRYQLMTPGEKAKNKVHYRNSLKDLINARKNVEVREMLERKNKESIQDAEQLKIQKFMDQEIFQGTPIEGAGTVRK